MALAIQSSNHRSLDDTGSTRERYCCTSPIERQFSWSTLAEIPRPSGFVTLLWWRNLSILAVAGLGLLSIPEWQSIVGIMGLIAFLYFSISTY
jgi:hypothetical protein